MLKVAKFFSFAVNYMQFCYRSSHKNSYPALIPGVKPSSYNWVPFGYSVLISFFFFFCFFTFYILFDLKIQFNFSLLLYTWSHVAGTFSILNQGH